ncbi:MAG: DUF4974 domain-containing protein [Bacteroidota bacterium]|nr:DUF4974 domain-containing protein [Bacteroidota bacterium]MDP4204911.1 DUF4974 domain-containing protein [Bacteroidota bacterium]
MKKEQLLQYVNGKLRDPKRLQEVYEWMEKDEKNKHYLIHLKNIQSFTVGKEGKIDLDYEYSLMQKRMQSRTKIIPFMKQALKYAAVLIFIIGLSWIIKLSLNTNREEYVNRIFCPNGETMKVKLDDGTLVCLNSGSTLSYPASFTKNHRSVKLIGEAFFTVKSDKNHPFIVNVNDIKVKVTGTEFDIDAYPCSHSLKTTLVKGRVDICDANEVSKLLLHPGQMANYNKTSQKLTVSDVDVSKYYSWTEGELTFRDTRIEEIAEKLSYWYNIKIRVDNENVKDFKVSCTAVKNRPIEDVLNSLKLLYKQVSYKTVIVNNKQEIIITKGM